MFAIIIRDLLLFFGVLAGLALPAWRGLKWTQGAERLALAVGIALLAGYLVIFGLYLAEVPLRWFWLLPAAGWLSGLIRPRWSSWSSDSAVTTLLARWGLLALWCLGWQGLVITYSGGGWTGDWVEHYDRASFFLQRWPAGHLFLDFYPLPARPPLANLWTAGLMALGGGAFTHYQVFSTLLASLVLLPLSALLDQWQAGRAAHWRLLCLLLLCPLFVQNATFPWTKLPAAFFVLLAIVQLNPAAGEPQRTRVIAGALLLAGGMLVHYSTGPWICGLGLAFAWLHRDRWRDREFTRTVVFGGLAAGLLLATWLAWSLATYGPATTFTANTAVALAPSGSLTERSLRAFGNLTATLLPTSAYADVPLLRQTSLLAQYRDFWFSLFQLTLPIAFGSAGCLVLAWQLSRVRWSVETAYWMMAVPIIVVLGTATHAQPSQLGLVQIALQPLVLLGLAWLVARAERLPRWLARLWIIGLILDFCLGILLHFSLQSLWIERRLHPQTSIPEILMGYNWPTRANYLSKAQLHLTFLADVLNPFACVALILGSAFITGWCLIRPLTARKPMVKGR